MVKVIKRFKCPIIFREDIGKVYIGPGVEKRSTNPVLLIGLITLFKFSFGIACHKAFYVG